MICRRMPQVQLAKTILSFSPQNRTGPLSLGYASSNAQSLHLLMSLVLVTYSFGLNCNLYMLVDIILYESTSLQLPWVLQLISKINTIHLYERSSFNWEALEGLKCETCSWRWFCLASQVFWCLWHSSWQSCFKYISGRVRILQKLILVDFHLLSAF